MRSFLKELFSSFLPSTYAGHIHLAMAKPWQFMPNWKDAALLNSLFFVFKISFMPKYRVIYYGYIVKWCSRYNVIGVHRWVLLKC